MLTLNDLHQFHLDFVEADNKWSTPQEAASWLHEPASMYEVIPSKPISTEEFTAKQLQWECMKAIQAVS